MTEQPLSILHVLAPGAVGGLETVVRTLASGHTSMGHTVQLAAVLDIATNPFVEEARDSGLTVHVINSPARSVQAERRAVRALLADGSIDVMHSHGYRSDILDLGIARSLGVPSVTTLHGFSATDWKARIYERLQIRSASRASAIVAVSTGVAETLIRHGAMPRSIHIVRNAISSTTPPLEPQAARDHLHLQSGKQIGWIGRLSSEKGPDVMLEAMAHLMDLDITLSFLGDGPNQFRLAERAEELGVTGRVRFHGRVQDAASMLPAFDVVALSSRTEGTPMALLEAMSARIPIVATRVGGVPDMLTSDEALLVGSDDPEGLAAALRSALTDRPAAVSRAERAHQRLVSQFDTQEWLAKYETIYRSIQPAIPRSRR